MMVILNAKKLRLIVQIEDITTALIFLKLFEDFNQIYQIMKKIKKL